MMRELGNQEVLALNGATAGPETSGHHSSVRIAIESIFRQKGLFLGLVLLVVGLTVAVTVLKKRQFQSEMKFLVQSTRSNSVISADRSSVTAAPDITEQQINSEIQLLLSQDVIGKVVDPNWSDSARQSRSQAEIQEHEGKIAGFTKHLSLEPTRKANVVTVTFLADSPENAANALDRLSAAYLTQRKRMTRPPGTSEFFAGETNRYKEAWAHANEELVKFQQANGIVSVPDTEEALTQQIASTENELRAAQGVLAESDQRALTSEKLASEVPERQSTQERLTPNQGGVQQLESLLVQLGNRRTELINRYQPTDRLVIEVDRQIADTKAALANMEDRKAKENTTDVNPAWQQVKSGLVQAKVEARAAQSRISTLNSNLSTLHQQLARLQPLNLKFNELQEQVDQARNNYEIFAQKRDQSDIEDAMDEKKLVNIAIAESPTMNFQQVAPRPLLYMALGLVTAMFVAGSAVYFAESTRSTIAVPRELDVLSRYPVLATLPLDRLRPEVDGAHLLVAAPRDEERAVLTGRSGMTPAVQTFGKVRET